MTLQQLQYILAIDRHRHFARAAEACFVTQATLSTMVQKLEAELDVQIFDRSRQPVVPTPIGERILEQARQIVQQATTLQDMVREERQDLSGTVRIGVIPTVAPYLLPGFLQAMALAHPDLRWQVTEQTTPVLVEQLRRDAIDLAVLATDPPQPLVGHALGVDGYRLYLAPGEPLLEKDVLGLTDLDPSRLWLLAEGHCMRTQVLNLCDLAEACNLAGPVRYDAGSIETLKQLVDTQGGYTLLPNLVMSTLTESQRDRVRSFAEPAPSRTLRLVHTPGFARQRLVKVVAEGLKRG